MVMIPAHTKLLLSFKKGSAPLSGWTWQTDIGLLKIGDKGVVKSYSMIPVSRYML